MSSSNDTLCGLDTGNILPGRTRSQGRKALINSVLSEVHPYLRSILRELPDDDPQWDKFRRQLDSESNRPLTLREEKWVRRESDAQGYWEEQVNRSLPTFGDCRYVEFSVEL